MNFGTVLLQNEPTQLPFHSSILLKNIVSCSINNKRKLQEQTTSVFLEVAI